MSISYPTVYTAWTGQPDDAPHGLVADDAGNVWAALQGGGRVVKFQVDIVDTDEVVLVEKASFADPQHPAELAFDGVFVIVTHSYTEPMFDSPALSDLVGVIAVASGEAKQVLLGCLNPTSGMVEPAPVKYGPGSIALGRDHVWLSCVPHVTAVGIEFDIMLPIRLNPTSGRCTPGWPFQEFADRVYWYQGAPEGIQFFPGPIAFDAAGGLHAAFDMGTEATALFCLHATTSSKVVEADELAVRSFGPAGAILATVPDRTPLFGTEGGGKGVVYPLTGVNDNDTVLWSVVDNRWIVGPGGGGGGFVAGQDLASISPIAQKVVGIRTVPVRVAAETPTEEYQVLMTRAGGILPFEYNLARLTEDMILPGFAITSFVCTSYTALQEVGTDIGSLVPISFTASYNQPAPYDAVTLRDSDNLVETDVSATPTGFDSPYTFVNKNTYGDAVTFRLSATKDGFLRQANRTITWVRRVYAFAAVTPGAFPAAFTQAWVEGNDPGTLATTKNQTFTVDAGALGDNKHIYYLYRDAYPASQFWVNGFQGGFTKLGTINLTTPGGVTEAYAVYESNQVGLGVTQVTVTD